MIRYCFSCLLLFFAFGYAQKDIILTGKVVEQNSNFNTGKIEYLSNVSVRSIGSSPVFSDDNGIFTLIFSDKPQGNVTRIYADKNNFELVNSEELKESAVLGRKSPLKIVMCKKGQLYENQLLYYNIAKDAAIKNHEIRYSELHKDNESKERIIKELEIQFNKKIATKEKAIELLSNELENSINKARKFSEQFATINLDDQSKTYQQAFRIFLNGDFKGALSILDNIDISKRLAENKMYLEKEESILNKIESNMLFRKDQMQKDIQQCVFKANLYLLDNDFYKAETQYKLALKYDDENLDILLEYSYFLSDQKEFNKCKGVINKALEKALIQEKTDELNYYRKLEKIYTAYGLLLYELYELHEAESKFQKALEISNYLSNINNEIFSIRTGVCLGNLGSLYFTKGEEAMAINYLKESLKKYKNINFDAEYKLISDKSRILKNLAECYLVTKVYDKAGQHIIESVEINEKLFGDFPNRHKLDYAKSLITKYIVLNAQPLNNQSIRPSFSNLELALKLLRELVINNKKANSRYLAQCLMEIGNVYSTNEKYKLADNFLSEALSLCFELTKKQPAAFILMLSDAIESSGYNLGGCAFNGFSIPKKSKEDLLTALELINNIPNKEEYIYYDYNLGRAYLGIGYLYYGENNYEKATYYLSTSLNYLNKTSFFSTNVEVYERDIYYYLGLLNWDIDIDIDKSKLYFEKAFDKSNDLLKDENSNYTHRDYIKHCYISINLMIRYYNNWDNMEKKDYKNKIKKLKKNLDKTILKLPENDEETKIIKNRFKEQLEFASKRFE